MPICIYTETELTSQSNLITEEYLYDFDKLRQMLIRDLPKMNVEQKNAFDEIINRTNSEQLNNLC